MVLLAITAAMVAPRMSSFFRGRALSFEARRLLSLTHLGQSRAIAEGVPVLLWLNPKEASYGLEVQAGSLSANPPSSSFTLDPSLTLETSASDNSAVSENGDETLGLPEGSAVIRFNPDGFFDESSVSKIVIRQGSEGALELVPTSNRLGYEILPATP